MSARAHGPRAYPILGQLPSFLQDKLGFLASCAEEYGEVTRLSLGTTTYLLNNAMDVEHVLIKNSANYRKSQRLTSRRGKELSGEGLLTLSGDDHLKQRRLIQPLFSQASMTTFASTIVRVARAWFSPRSCDIAAEMAKLTQRIMLESLFGGDLEEAEFSRLACAIDTRQRYIQYIFDALVPFPELAPKRRRVYRSAMQELDATIYREIDRWSEAQPHGACFLQMLVQARDKDGAGMDAKIVRDEALTLAITGFETIGEALTWTLFLLAKHPELEQMALAEIEQVVGKREPSYSDAQNLRLVRRILFESMRLYPPTWVFIRMALDGDRLPSGYFVEPGAKIYLCPYIMHRNPAYFPDPERFKPERFDAEAVRSRPKLAYFPFGAGVRRCIGEPFAMLEMVLVLATLLPRFKVHLRPNQHVVPEPAITLRPKNGIQVTLRERARVG